MIIGAAFGKIVDSLVKDLVMPVVGRIFGGLDFSNHFIVLRPPPPNYTGPMTYEALTKAGVPLLAYGNFLTVAINFVILAFIIFLMVRQINRLRRARRRRWRRRRPRTCCCCARSATAAPLSRARPARRTAVDRDAVPGAARLWLILGTSTPALEDFAADAGPTPEMNLIDPRAQATLDAAMKLIRDAARRRPPASPRT